MRMWSLPPTIYIGGKGRRAELAMSPYVGQAVRVTEREGPSFMTSPLALPRM